MRRLGLVLLGVVALLSFMVVSVSPEVGAAPAKEPTVSVTARFSRDCTSVTLTGKYANLPAGTYQPSFALADWTVYSVIYVNFDPTTATRGSYQTTIALTPDGNTNHQLDFWFNVGSGITADPADVYLPCGTPLTQVRPRLPA